MLWGNTDSMTRDLPGCRGLVCQIGEVGGPFRELGECVIREVGGCTTLWGNGHNDLCHLNCWLEAPWNMSSLSTSTSSSSLEDGSFRSALYASWANMKNNLWDRQVWSPHDIVSRVNSCQKCHRVFSDDWKAVSMISQQEMVLSTHQKIALPGNSEWWDWVSQRACYWQSH